MVEIGMYCLQWSPQPVYESCGWGQLWLEPHPLFTSRTSVFGPVEALHGSLTLPMSHYKYDKWLDMVEIGIHCV